MENHLTKKKLHEVKEFLGAGALNFFGRQFAGKDIQAAKLGKSWDAPVIGGGDILRGDNIPQHIRDIMNRGELAPTDEYKAIVTPYLSSRSAPNRPLLLSSIGRMKGEEQAVIEAAKDAGHPIVAAVYLEITEAEAFNRLKASPSRGRVDDTDEGLHLRLELFKEQTLPVIETYEDMGLLVRVNAMPEEAVVFESLVRKLHEHVGK